MHNRFLHKSNPRHITILAMQIVFLLTLVYQTYFIYKLYKDISTKQQTKATTKPTTSNSTAYSAAVKRYQANQEYPVPSDTVTSPFKVPPSESKIDQPF